MADELENTTDTQNELPSFDPSSFVPETFKKDDGSYDVEGFTAHLDGLTAFKAQADEAASALPESADGYAFALSEGFKLPEGFKADLFTEKDEAGNDVPFDVNSLIASDDPDIPALQAIMHEAGVQPGVMNKIADVFVSRELRAMMGMMEKAEEHKAALGPNAQARIDTVTRTANAKLPAEQAKALLDSITSADTLRALETLLKPSQTPVSPVTGGKPLSEMSVDERLEYGFSQRKKA